MRVFYPEMANIEAKTDFLGGEEIRDPQNSKIVEILANFGRKTTFFEIFFKKFLVI